MVSLEVTEMHTRETLEATTSVYSSRASQSAKNIVAGWTADGGN